jgi:hypothetical protein
MDKIKISFRRIRIGQNLVTEPVVCFGDKRLPVTDHLPSNLTRLMPQPWGNATPAQWKPFVITAVAMGYL